MVRTNSQDAHIPPCKTGKVPESGTRNVYAAPGSAGLRWRARVSKTVNIPGRYADRAGAARALGAWLAEFYARVSAGRVARGGPPLDVGRAVAAVTLRARRNVGYVRRCGRRYMAFAYVLGEAQVVTASVLTPGLPPPRWAAGRRTWATKAEARAAAKLWVRRFRASFGLFERYAGLWLWR